MVPCSGRLVLLLVAQGLAGNVVHACTFHVGYDLESVLRKEVGTVHFPMGSASDYFSLMILPPAGDN